MATNNAVNLNSSGIVSYDGAGTFSALANPLTVSNGGSGASSFTAYSVLCAGTTSTGALQNVSGVGTAGQFLSSNGASALPTFQNPGGYVMRVYSGNTSIGDLSNYYTGINESAAIGRPIGAFYIPKNGTVISCYGVWTCSVTSSAQNCTFYIRKNDTTDTKIADVQFTTTSGSFNNTSLNVAVSAGDYINVKLSSPNLTTNPSGVFITCSVYII